jgi:hypothetical protein
MPAYDAARFDPPAPVAPVIVRSKELGIEVRDVPLLLDTGADVSLLPRSQLAALVAPDAKQYELEAFDGTRSTAPAVTAEIELLGKTFRGQFLLIDGWHGVLGRNVLNNLSLLFDGPSRQWAEHRCPPVPRPLRAPHQPRGSDYGMLMAASTLMTHPRHAPVLRRATLLHRRRHADGNEGVKIVGRG